MQDNYTIKREITVAVPIEKAFRVFTEGFDAWWPRTHHIGKPEMKEAILEMKQGGRWYELGVDGSTTEWGKVVSVDPPARIVLLWQIDANWAYNPLLETEVEISFRSEGANKTHVTLLHKNLDRYGDDYSQFMGSLGSDGGWLGLMKVFAAEAEGNITEKNRMLKEYAVGMEELNVG
ncbi:MAG: SRPBCC family protein [Candidatus Kapaibacterium sp.]